MQLLDSITIVRGSETRTIELYEGDLTRLTLSDAVDILVVSAFPNTYSPAFGTLIGELLYNSGVSVESLARKKDIDLRKQFGCWLSTEIEGQPFKRIFCFEPLLRGSPPEVVSDIFESLAPFLLGEYANATIAMPLVAAGQQGSAPEEMLRAVLEASTQWLSKGLSLRCLKIVERSTERAAVLKRVFTRFKNSFQPSTEAPAANLRYDVFVSYAHQDAVEVDLLMHRLYAEKKELSCFLDRVSLRQGMAWQQHLYEALDACRKVIVVLSPHYLASKHCKFEFNVALLRQNDSDVDIVLPVYLQTTDLPTYMRLLQHVDCRERDPAKLSLAAHEILSSLAV